ncbi:MAG TPA: hypothetical protein DCS87_12295 [Rheinheimera sp.]|nr:hypothetical protein [Rheinheimera sp.]
MKALDVYINAIAAELPVDKQTEICREIRATLLDELDAKREQLGHALADNDVAALLQSWGHPVQVAQRYHTEPALIASEDMPLFRTVLTYGAALLAALAVLKSLSGLVSAQSINPLQLLMHLGFAFVDMFSTFLLATIAAFYLLGRSGELQKWRLRPWTLADLPQLPQARLQLSDTVSDLVSGLFLLLLLWTSLWMSAERAAALPLQLNPDVGYLRYLLTALGVWTVLSASYRLTRRHWTLNMLRWLVAELTAYLLVVIWMGLQWPVLQWAAVQTDGWQYLPLHGIERGTVVVTALVVAWQLWIHARLYRQLQATDQSNS